MKWINFTGIFGWIFSIFLSKSNFLQLLGNKTEKPFQSKTTSLNSSNMTIKRSFYTHKIWNNNIQIECIDKNCQKWWNWCIIIISLWHKLPKRFQMSTNCWHKQGGVCTICIQSFSRLGSIWFPCKITVPKQTADSTKTFLNWWWNRCILHHDYMGA